MEHMKKKQKISLHNNNIDTTKLPNPINKTRVFIMVFIMLPYLKFWAQACPQRMRL